jgi:hypothetical protein
VLVVAAAVACGKLASELNQVIAISTTAPDSLEEYDTLTPSAVAFNGSGDTVKTTILWASLDSVLKVLNDTSGRTIVAFTRQPGRLQAQVGTLFSNPLVIRALAAADTLFATPPVTLVDTVTLSSTTPPDSLSAPLNVTLADTALTATAADTIIPLAGRPVVFAVTYRATTDSVTLTSDTAHAFVTADTVSTSGLGVAFVKVRLLAGTLPDSIVVTASAQRAVHTGAVHTPVPGRVTFIVRFQP